MIRTVALLAALLLATAQAWAQKPDTREGAACMIDQNGFLGIGFIYDGVCRPMPPPLSNAQSTPVATHDQQLPGALDRAMKICEAHHSTLTVYPPLYEGKWKSCYAVRSRWLAQQPQRETWQQEQEQERRDLEFVNKVAGEGQ